LQASCHSLFEFHPLLSFDVALPIDHNSDPDSTYFKNRNQFNSCFDAGKLKTLVSDVQLAGHDQLAGQDQSG